MWREKYLSIIFVDITSIKSIGRRVVENKDAKKGEQQFVDYAVVERKPLRNLVVKEDPEDIRKQCERYYEQQERD